MNELIIAAEKAVGNSYSPYSGFAVGAALLCSDGKVFTGCNIESASYSATVCAERTAFFKAVSEGEKDFSALAVIAVQNGKTVPFCTPCGICRQVMSEFCRADFRIYITDGETVKEYTLAELLPLGFGPMTLLGGN